MSRYSNSPKLVSRCELSLQAIVGLFKMTSSFAQSLVGIEKRYQDSSLRVVASFGIRLPEASSYIQLL
jgi:hypothetical protein